MRCCNWYYHDSWLLQPAGRHKSKTQLSRKNSLGAGTLPYMAPEQLRGEPVDGRTDIWAAGVVLYEMATGRRPFDKKLSTALAAEIINEPPPPPARFRPGLPPRLEDLILKCLEKDPDHRYQSAKELTVDLRRLAAPSLGSAESRQVHKRSRLSFAIAALALLSIVAVLFILNVGGWRQGWMRPASAPRIEPGNRRGVARQLSVPRH